MALISHFNTLKLNSGTAVGVISDQQLVPYHLSVLIHISISKGNTPMKNLQKNPQNILIVAEQRSEMADQGS